MRDVRSGNIRAERYDALVLSPGAAPIRPPLPGIDLPGVFAVRNIPDSRRIRSWIADRHAGSAVIVGGGFIGLEMVDNVIHRGLAVTVLEKLSQVMPPLDPEMAVPLMEHVVSDGQLPLLTTISCSIASHWGVGSPSSAAPRLAQRSPRAGSSPARRTTLTTITNGVSHA